MKKITSDQNAVVQEIEEDVVIPHHKFHWEPKRLPLQKHQSLSDQFSTIHDAEINRNVQDHLRETVNKIMTPGKSILNCDESVKLGEHLVRYGLHNNEVNRRRLRNVLLDSHTSAEDSIASYISLVCLGHEAVFQKNENGELLRDILKNKGILLAIQVDKGAAPMYNNNDNHEFVIQGLDDLDKRCLAYRKAGCDATKFTAFFEVGTERLSERVIQDNVHSLARFAAVSQAHCLVPIIGCELSMHGNNDVDRTERTMELILVELMVALTDKQVLLEATILAPNMCTPGKKCPTEISTTHMACASVLSIRRTIPPAVAGIAFLTTEQKLEESCVNLDAISKIKICKPWPITSISGEALLDTVVSIWAGNDLAIEKARSELLKWSMINSLAARGVFINVKEESHLEAEHESCV